ncbi:hypothetical protein PR048_000601 [Dryococelus australis]|uniref:Uncharacterized protein n=1 Tax=Dryococelus australis TaxID=614101 RepID=A0ABQ9IF82_9NEOP|nr:hypothetical protein PR048_000601 [Dryococelus australis]
MIITELFFPILYFIACPYNGKRRDPIAKPPRVSPENLVCEEWSSAGMKGRGNGKSPRKSADQWHRPTRFQHAKIRSDPTGDRTRIALVGGEQANRSWVCNRHTRPRRGMSDEGDPEKIRRPAAQKRKKLLEAEGITWYHRGMKEGRRLSIAQYRTIRDTSYHAQPADHYVRDCNNTSRKANSRNPLRRRVNATDIDQPHIGTGSFLIRPATRDDHAELVCPIADSRLLEQLLEPCLRWEHSRPGFDSRSGHPDFGFPWFPELTPGECWDGSLTKNKTDSFPNPSSPCNLHHNLACWISQQAQELFTQSSSGVPSTRQQTSRSEATDVGMGCVCCLGVGYPQGVEWGGGGVIALARTAAAHRLCSFREAKTLRSYPMSYPGLYPPKISPSCGLPLLTPFFPGGLLPGCTIVIGFWFGTGITRSRIGEDVGATGPKRRLLSVVFAAREDAVFSFLQRVARVPQMSRIELEDRPLPYDLSYRTKFKLLEENAGVIIPLRNRISAFGNRAGRLRWSAGFLGDLPFPPPTHAFSRCSILTSLHSRETSWKWSSDGMQGRGKREFPEKIRRPAVSSGTILTYENPEAVPPGIEPGSPSWEAAALDTTALQSKAKAVICACISSSVSHGAKFSEHSACPKAFSQLDEFERVRIVGLREEKLDVSAHCSPLETAHTHGEGSGRPWRIASREDPFIVRQAVSFPRASLHTIQGHIIAADDSPAHTGTISRWLAERDLSSRVVTLRIGEELRSGQLVVLSGYIRLPNSSLQIFWPAPLSTLHFRASYHSYKSCLGVRSPLVLDDNPIFQQDKARSHVAWVSMTCFRDVSLLPWPAGSPDLLPIENVLDRMGRHRRPTETTADLQGQLRQLWPDLPQENIASLFSSMSDHYLHLY